MEGARKGHPKNEKRLEQKGDMFDQQRYIVRTGLRWEGAEAERGSSRDLIALPLRDQGPSELNHLRAPWLFLEEKVKEMKHPTALMFYANTRHFAMGEASLSALQDPLDSWD